VSPQTLAHGLHSHKRGWRSLEQAHHTQSTCFLSLRLGTQSGEGAVCKGAGKECVYI
jgi:hypothetical protein